MRFLAIFGPNSAQNRWEIMDVHPQPSGISMDFMGAQVAATN